MSAFPIIKGMLTSPDYHFRNFIAMMVNDIAVNEVLWNELLKVDLTEELKTVSMPYFIMQGDTDIVTSTNTISAMVNDIHNEHISMEIIPNSGHMTGQEGFDRMLKKLEEFTDEQDHNK